MSLVKCPECGREGVSDSAKTCPNCGYEIKAHFDKIKKEEEDKKAAELKQKEEAERQRKAIAEKKRLEEANRIEEEEREIREYQQRLENKKKAKIIKIVLAICVAVILIFICVICVTKENKKNALRDLADKSFATDFAEYLKEVNTYGLNIEATYELNQNSESYEDGVLLLTCVVSYTSDDISQYLNAEFDSAEAKKLCFLLKDIAKFEQQTLHYSYASDDGTVRVDVPYDYGDPRITVYDKDRNIYKYTYSVDYDNLEINGDYAYMESDGSYQPSESFSSYTGSYDATLEYGSGSVLVCISKDAMSRYFSALNNNNQGTIDEMENSGEIGWTAKGTKCNIVKREIGSYQVKLLDGLYEGNTVYVISESVNEK